MFASARATVAGAQPATELAAMLNDKGLVVPPEDAPAFAAAIESLCDDPQRAAQMGANAQKWVRSELAQDAVLGRFEAALERLIQSASSSA